MTVGEFAPGLLRLAAIILPVVITAHGLRVRYIRVRGSLALLACAVLALSVLLVVAEFLGLASLDRPAALIGVLSALALVSHLVCVRAPRPRRTGMGTTTFEDEEAARKPGLDPTLPSAIVGVAVVAAQWCVQSANALGAGMFNFDTLWYHMPFAARFAQSGSVTGIQFTQADPFVAYYPANSELFHAVGIEALHSDFLSPLLNLMWLAIALLAAWCLGRPWRVQPLTLLAGCLVVSLPVLSATQPGEAFNDIVGLAALLAAAALAVNASENPGMLVVAGLAFGLAVGTKFTFLVPVFVLALGLTLRAERGRRGRTLAQLGVPAALTGGWWYLRNVIAVGNPVGLRAHLGPLVLPGPHSQLAGEVQQTVISEVSHLSLWGSRFAPGLDHALGALWPLVLLLYIGAMVAGIVLVKDWTLRLLAIAAALTGVSYLFLPTGASGIAHSTEIFQVNLRYATPALALGILILPIVVRLRIARALPVLGPVLALILLAAQLQHQLWPTQTTRHIAFLALAGAVAALAWYGRALKPRLSGALLAPAISAVLLVALAATFALQRHYFHRRYLVGDTGDPGLGALYRWAQGVANARIALYGTVEQYPLYGARDTNIVDYLGARTGAGGFRPIGSCARWRAALAEGRYQWVVITPAPTPAVPVAWTQGDPAMKLVLHPGAGAFVFAVNGRPDPALCA